MTASHAAKPTEVTIVDDLSAFSAAPVAATSDTTQGAVSNALATLTTLEIDPAFQKPIFTLNLSDDAKAKIPQLAASVNFDDPMSVLGFSEGPQQELTNKLKALHAYYGTARNLGGVGDLLLKLQKGVIIIDELKTRAKQTTTADDVLRKPEPKKTFFQRAKEAVQEIEILGIGKAVATAELNHMRNQELTTIFDEIEGDLKKKRREQLESLTVLDVNARAVDDNIQMQMIYAIAGQLAMARGRKEYELAKNDPNLPGDPTAITRLKQRKDRIEAFSRKLLELKAWIIELAFLTTPRVQEMHTAVEGGIESLSKTLQRDLPRLVQAALDCGILFRLQDAQEQASQLNAMSNAISRRSGELFEQVAVAGKKAQGDLADQVKTLQELGDVLLATKTKLAEIDKTNKGKLENTQRELAAFADKMQQGMRAEL